MTQGFSPYSGGSFGSPSEGFSAAAPTSSTSAPPTGPVSSVSTRVESAPVARLLPSLALGLLSLGLSVLITFGSYEATDTSFAIFAFVSWAIAGILGISLLGWYFAENNRRRGESLYVDVGWKKAVYVITLVVLASAVVWSAINIAQWAGKL